MCVCWIAIEMLIFLLNPVDSYITAFWEMCKSLYLRKKEGKYPKKMISDSDNVTLVSIVTSHFVKIGT